MNPNTNLRTFSKFGNGKHERKMSSREDTIRSCFILTYVYVSSEERTQKMEGGEGREEDYSKNS